MRASIFSALYFLRRSALGRSVERFAGLKRLYRYVLQKINPCTQLLARAQGNTLYLDTRDEFIARSLLSHGVWEEFETEVFKDIISPGDVVLDIGAHIGYYALIAARIVGDTGKVYAFEPEPYNRSLLEKNIDLNAYSNIECIGKGVSNHSGTGAMYMNSYNFGAATFSRRNIVDDLAATVEVELITLDAYFHDVVGDCRVNVMSSMCREPRDWSSKGRKKFWRKTM